MTHEEPAAGPSRSRTTRLVVLVVVVLAAVLLASALLRPSPGTRPSSTPTPPGVPAPAPSAGPVAVREQPAPQEWQPTDCDAGQNDGSVRERGDACAVPAALAFGDLDLVARRAYAQETRGSARTHRTLSIRLDHERGERWVLVGARGSTRSELTVWFDSYAPVRIEPGQLSLLRAPESDRRYSWVTLSEGALALPRETLVARPYVLRG